MNEVATTERKSVLNTIASRFNMEPKAFEQVVRRTVVPDEITNEQFAAFLMVANEYKLNPVTKEIYAFPTKGGGIQPIVSIDGWLNIINSHPDFDGMEFVDNMLEGKLVSITCKMHRKGRNNPTEVTEYMGECNRGTDPWKKYPTRMLRHKAVIQAARYAFGFSGIIEPDEAERYDDAGVININKSEENKAHDVRLELTELIKKQAEVAGKTMLIYAQSVGVASIKALSEAECLQKIEQLSVVEGEVVEGDE